MKVSGNCGRPAIVCLALCLFAGLFGTSEQVESTEQVPSKSNEKLFEKCLEANKRSVEHLQAKQQLPALTRICTSLLFHDKGPHASLKEQLFDDALAQSDHHKEGRTRRSIEDFGMSDDLEKRGGQNRMLHFGKRTPDQGYNNENTEEEILRQLVNSVKRVGQERVLHFGKRTPNRFLHFGKRTPNKFMHFGKRFPDNDVAPKRSDRFMHFGKREDGQIDEAIATLLNEELDKNVDPLVSDLTKRSPNGRFMHFGKRFSADDNQINVDDDSREILKRNPSNNRYLHFGKKAANRFMHFGKRSDLNDEQTDPKERMRRSVITPLTDEDISEDFNTLRPISSKRFSLSYANLPVRQAMLQHKFTSLSKNDLENDDAFQQADNSLLDRIVRSEQYQMIRPRIQSRLTRPDRNVFLHFG